MGDNTKANSKKINRRDILKGFATVPIFGIAAYDYWKNEILGKVTDKALQLNLGLNEAPAVLPKTTFNKNASLVRVGIVGVGYRGSDLLKSLGFVQKSWYDNLDKQSKRGDVAAVRRLQTYRNQEVLNVQITGICDVFDLHAEKGLDIVQNGIQPNGETVNFKGVKRYKTYQEMVKSSNIDAVIISTPDFHHADMVLEAVKERKHIYCEKGLTISEDELTNVYDAVKGSNLVFQLGHQNSKNQTFKIAKDIIDKGILGKVTLIETTTNRNSKHGAWIRHLNKDGSLKPGSLSTIDWEQWLGETEKVPFSIERYYGWARWFAYDTVLGIPKPII